MGGFFSAQLSETQASSILLPFHCRVSPCLRGQSRHGHYCVHVCGRVQCVRKCLGLEGAHTLLTDSVGEGGLSPTCSCHPHLGVREARKQIPSHLLSYNSVIEKGRLVLLDDYVFLSQRPVKLGGWMVGWMGRLCCWRGDQERQDHKGPS